MGGKRPDQHNIDPGEAGSTNYQWRGEGRSADENIQEKDKQEYQASEKAKTSRSMIPESGTNPAARDHRAAKMAGATDEGRTADEKVDEASQESFPASDPPAQP